ncbi:lytic murein transglycosylase [Rhodobacteraceae bacterium 2376]|uniref:Lytic murein transglycosylase n=1 Tax=Rhabdonatronobacter sediminivivens TaxID=2743469 RepID=A0A7Z0KXX2_9RHOB|nr:lytic murein transglycosylase [Rhabdonatronobacter sediminivivens]NYS24740.1 lytic murein transglycosylase [Rhabdonatronobacter sediminivivens]
MRAILICLLLLLPGCVGANVDRSPRPEARPEAGPEATRAASFDGWVAAFRPRALAAGVQAPVFDRAMADVRPLPATLRLDRAQSEFGTHVWDYLDAQVTAARISRGRQLLASHDDLLGRITARYGVEPEVLVAIWGLETSYGAVRGSTPILSTLATLARDGRRAAFFEQELIAALKIVQAGEVTPARMIGSWAGAMGHTQFMPSSYLDHAVDFTGNGRRDVWSDNPADALASAAHYLSANGWQRGQPWAVEVRLPQGFDLGLTGTRRGVDAWRALGVAAVAGAQLPAQGTAKLMLPAGRHGPALLTFGNYDVLKTYNISDAYVIALGHLADRLRGAGPFASGWPRGDRALNLNERMELQRRLNAQGFDTAGIDGRLGPATRAAVRAWQARQGLVPDGYISVQVLEALRGQ